MSKLTKTEVYKSLLRDYYNYINGGTKEDLTKLIIKVEAYLMNEIYLYRMVTIKNQMSLKLVVHKLVALNENRYDNTLISTVETGLLSNINDFCSIYPDLITYYYKALGLNIEELPLEALVELIVSRTNGRLKLTINESIQKINKQLKEEHSNNYFIDYIALKEILGREGFPINFMIGASHEFVSLDGYLSIKAKRLKMTIQKKYRTNSSFSYYELVPTFVFEDVKDMYIKDILNTIKRREQAKSKQYDIETNLKIDKFKALLEDSNISVETFNKLNKQAQKIKKHLFKYDYDKCSLNSDLNKYKKEIK